MKVSKVHFVGIILGRIYVAVRFQNGVDRHYWLQEPGAWQPSTIYGLNTLVQPSAPNGFYGLMAGAGVVNGAISAAEAAYLYNSGSMRTFADLSQSTDPMAVSLWARMYYAWQLDELATQTNYRDQKGRKDLTKLGTVGSYVDPQMGRVAQFDRTGYLRAVGVYGPTSWHRTMFAWVKSTMPATPLHDDMLMGNYDSVSEGKLLQLSNVL